MPHKKPQTQLLMQDVMELVFRYRILVPEAVAKYFKTSKQLAKSTLERLVEENRLCQVSLYRNQRCYVLDSMKDGKPSPMSENEKTRRYATLAFCLLGGRRRHKLTPDEMSRNFGSAKPSENYYIDNSSEQPVMGYVRIDLAGVGRWDRIVAKALNDVRFHMEERAFHPIVSQRAFEVRIVTPLGQKAERIRKRLDNSGQRDIPIHVTTIPELINLIQPLANNRIASPRG